MQQTCEMLGQAKKFYSAICDYYESLAKETDDERVRMLLHYLSEHQAFLEEKISEFEKTTSETAMRTWYQTATPNKKMMSFIDELKTTPNPNIDKVVEIGLRANKEITEFYRHLSEKSELEEAREIFRNLLEKQEEESHELVKSAQELKDL